MRRFIIDTDTASDDAVAILMALRSPDVQVDAITMVSGNVPVEMGARNASYTVELCGKETPVHIGCNRPLVREAQYAYFFHGPDGMGGMNYPAARRAPEQEHAVDALIRLVRAHPGEYTLVTLGPLTNIAMALRRAPDFAQKVKQVYVMGGAACTVGNITPAAEYNIWVDPEAAHIVFYAGLPILMIGWEHCRGVSALTNDDMAFVRAINTKYAHFTLDCNKSALKASTEWTHEPGLTLPDPVAMSIALDPTICTRRSRNHVEIEIASEVTRGMTVVDEIGVTNKPPIADICWAMDARRWKEMLYGLLR
jgi:purine nucleosidase